MQGPPLTGAEADAVELECRFCTREAKSKTRAARKVAKLGADDLRLLTTAATAGKLTKGLLKGDAVLYYCGGCSRALTELRKGDPSAQEASKGSATP